MPKFTRKKPPTEKPNPIVTDAETEAILAQIEAQRDYYHTCINGSY